MEKKTGFVLLMALLATNLAQPFFKGYNISTVYKDRNQNYWFATINNGFSLVPNLHVQFLKVKYYHFTFCV